MRDTGVVYQNIDRPKGILNLQEHVLAGIVVGNVCQNCHTGNAHFFQFFFRFCQLVFAARSVQHHSCACSSKGKGNGFANATGGTGDQYGFICKIHFYHNPFLRIIIVILSENFNLYKEEIC